MQNLLRESITEPELVNVFERSPARALTPPLGDPAWIAIRTRPHLASNVKRLVDSAHAELDVAFPKLTNELYTSFHRLGERLSFDLTYQTRRRLFSQCALAALLAEDPAPFLPVLFDRWRDTLNEESWALSAHVKAPSGRDPRVLDLTASETTNTVAELVKVFEDVMPSDLKASAIERVSQNIDVFLEGEQSPWGWFRSTHNWNAVCHQGIVGAALNIESNPSRLAAILSRASQDLPIFLDGFSPDGGCTEGPSYWEYGFGWFAWLNNQLEMRTNNKLSLFHRDPLISKIARYGIHFQIPFSSKINFSDCLFHGRLPAGLISYLGNRINDDDLRQCAHALYENEEGKWGELKAVNQDALNFFTASRNFLHAPSKLGKNVTFPVSSNVYPNLEVWNVRDIDPESGVAWSVAAKGGHNGEHHNHNDCGSFILHLDEVPIGSELGMPNYEKRYFHGDRYSFLVARSLGHSVPLINGCEQRAGKAYAAKIQTMKIDESPVFEADIAGCYPECARCHSSIRRIAVEKAPLKVTISDNITLLENFSLETALITLGNTKVLGDTEAYLSMEGYAVSIKTFHSTRIDRLEHYTYTDRSGKIHDCQRIVFTAALPFENSITLGYTLAPIPHSLNIDTALLNSNSQRIVQNTLTSGNRSKRETRNSLLNRQ